MGRAKPPAGVVGDARFSGRAGAAEPGDPFRDTPRPGPDIEEES
ncbi:hypothetical protein [Saccharothrix variisporea]|uniref:Uncharacterized protein n=1 Tax=Saccharothrix variisporea TaxID=543527 RepID=A0A495X6T7_9PSEU|nr:hypothetical protein [Saccharothrix variisporea]RKT69249.1 hypothetical protein DFJ66_2447 [Saccharothrix variisporea]